MTALFSTAIPIVAALFAVGALLFFLRGLRIRRHVSERAYTVERQEARREMLVAFLRGGVLLILSLLLLAVFGLSPDPDSSAATESSMPTRTATAAPTVAATPLPTSTVTRRPVSTTGPTSLPMPSTSTPSSVSTPTSTATETAVTSSAVVDSPNGLWLRESPGGTQQVELIAHQTTLVLLPGLVSADGDEWQQVRTPAGNDGWVAARFIIYQ